MTWQGPDGPAPGQPEGGATPDEEATRSWDAPPEPPAQPAPGELPATPPPPPSGPPGAWGGPPPPDFAGTPTTPPPASPPAGGYGGAVPPPTVTWAPPVEQPGNVPGAPGLVFSGALGRVVAYIIDAIIVGILSGIVAGVLGVNIYSLYALGRGTTGDLLLVNGLYTLVAAGIQFLYFAGLWTSGMRATLGQRLLRIQVGNAFDGRTITIEQGVRRWIGLGLPLSLLSIIPTLGPLAGTLQFLWSLVLLVSVATSPTKQGLHDRFANTAVVQPVGTSAGPLVIGCLLLIALFVVLPFVALIFLGSQLSNILSDFGASI